MLVLSRKQNEAIVIDGNIRVTVLGNRGGLVRLGIEAPEQVIILREELSVAMAADAAFGDRSVEDSSKGSTPHTARASGSLRRRTRC